MRTVQDIYTEYRIMPFLQLHQLRVAGVASIVAKNIQLSVADIQQVLLACLFHDMGNIIKSDLDVFPESVQPEGIEFWQKVKADFVAKYGGDEHRATIAIAHELSLPSPVCELIGGFGFSKSTYIAEHGSLMAKICEYADMRVAPNSVVTIDERLEDGRARYASKGEHEGFGAVHYNRLAGSLKAIEKELFADSPITPEDITDPIIGRIIEPLKKLPL